MKVIDKTQLETMGYTFGNEKFNEAESHGGTPGFKSKMKFNP